MQVSPRVAGSKQEAQRISARREPPTPAPEFIGPRLRKTAPAFAERDPGALPLNTLPGVGAKGPAPFPALREPIQIPWPLASLDQGPTRQGWHRCLRQHETVDFKEGSSTSRRRLEAA